MQEALNDPNSLCIVTIMKSGTHWMRYLFANYQNLLLDGEGAVTYERLMDTYSPTDRRATCRGEQDYFRSSIYPMHGISDIMWQHVSPHLDGYQGRMLFLYRNPLDYAVSRYFYDKDFWLNEGRDVSSIGLTMNWSLEWYAKQVRRMLDLKHARLLPITYEELKAAPVQVMGCVFRWAGLPYHHEKVKRAVLLSDAKNVRKEENQRKQAILGTGKHFVRDSSVGQWKKYLSEDDVELARRILSNYGLRFENFTMELD